MNAPFAVLLPFARVRHLPARSPWRMTGRLPVVRRVPLTVNRWPRSRAPVGATLSVPVTATARERKVFVRTVVTIRYLLLPSTGLGVNLTLPFLLVRFVPAFAHGAPGCLTSRVTFCFALTP